MCKVDGCGKESVYKKQDVCQMHYFRMMRNGSYSLKRSPNGKRKNRKDRYGYVLVYLPNHPLARKDGLVFEHRVVMYEKYGEEMPPCQKCGALSDWSSRFSHVDHINEIKDDNRKENLRILCNPCNTRRTKRIEYKAKGRKGIEWQGEIKTAQEWGRDIRIPAKGHLIRQRLARGLSVEEAFFNKKVTHKKNPSRL